MSHEEEGRFFTPHADSDVQSEFEESDMERPPEEQEVPFIVLYLTGRGITDLVLKLPAVREVFSRMMASIHNKSFLYVAGKQILMLLAAANKQDPRGVQRAYDEMIQFLREPSYQEMIEAEVLDAQLYHFNLLDVFFELVFFSCLINGLAPEASDGGFLQHVFNMNSQWDVDIREPEAE
ncbi:mitoguardin 1-like [Tachysurus fulvidraco]|uniref:mitoguardin 1-like n=1 Tax=Tachysurus fulvidraco TaxID=1234273 RepID=UPI001FEDEEC1|nr:mitoguardin 1-like [Tachysurus fulvidraco]